MGKSGQISAGRRSGDCAGPTLFVRAALMLLAAAALSVAVAQAQTHTQLMTVRLVEARSGKPIRNKTVSIAFYVEDSSMTNGRRRVAFPDGSFWINLDVDKDGLGSIQVPGGATLVEVGKGLDNDGSKTTEKAIQLDMCQGRPGFTKPDAGFQYGRVEEVMRSGSVAFDPDCQPRLKLPAAPGEFVVMAWPPSRLPLPSGMSW